MKFILSQFYRSAKHNICQQRNKVSRISSASELLPAQSKLVDVIQTARLCLTTKTFCMAFSVLEKCLYNIKQIFQHFPQLNSISTIQHHQGFLLDICTVQNSCLEFSLQQLLARKYKKAFSIFPYSGVTGMSRGILAVGLHVDFQSLQR